jgi:LAS superfamily LD-carboxypeptidase LdcB
VLNRLPKAAAAALALVLSSCAAPADSGFDLDEDPSTLSEHAGKADGDICGPYPGGTLSGDDLLVLVNKEAGQALRSDWAPPDVVALPADAMMPGREGLLRIAAHDSFMELRAAAASEAGLELGARSAYRSFRTQCITFDFKVKQHGLDHAKRFSAEPGRSQHQLGTTIDITSPRIGWQLSQSMGDTPEGRWLEENAHRFGFALSYPLGEEATTGYAYEPWHYRYLGREAAAELHESGLILEVYLQECAVGAPGLTCPREEAPVLEPNHGFIGGTCSADIDCSSLGPEAVCLGAEHGYSGGHCTIPCSRFCPDRPGLNAGTFCVASATAGGLCHSRCDTELFPDTGCREGYECQSTQRPDGSSSADACLPAAEQR